MGHQFAPQHPAQGYPSSAPPNSGQQQWDSRSLSQSQPPPTQYAQRPMSYAPPQGQGPPPQQYQLPPMPQHPPLQAAQGYYQPQPPAQQMYQQPPQNYSAPPPAQGTYMASPPPGQHQFQGVPGGYPASASASSLSLNSLSLSSNSNSNGASPRAQYYATPEDGPPFKLAVTHPDQKMLASMREAAVGPQGDIAKRVAWAKQVLKYIERHQSLAGESSRINDPTLVRWTDEALTHILTSASSSSPVPLALYLRGELSSSGSFPSYRAKDPKTAFRDFEAASNAGYEKAWFRIGRAYEDFGDVRRAVGAYERGIEKGDCGSTYRLAMAYLLGQIGLASDPTKAIALLKRAADTADLDTPQPPYILGMLLSGEFESPAVQLPKDIVPLNIDEAKWRIERAAYLSFGPAQYKMGFSYEYATLGCLFDPLLSVQYYALASQNGEVEADMALSKWYLCGSEGNFDKDEGLAFTFAEKAASRQLPSAEFALGYYREVGINGLKDIEQAKRWYARAAQHGNLDARDRLDALSQSEANVLNRVDHETHVDSKLVRKRTQAQARSNEQRERIAATSLAASLGGSAPQPPPQRASSYNPAPPQQQQQQQQQYSQQQHQNLSLSQNSYQQQQQPGRPVSSMSTASGGSNLRRQNTYNQVQAAAGLGQHRMTPLSSSTGGPGRRPPPQHQGSVPPRQGVQLSDNGPRPPPSNGQGGPSRQQTQQQQQPQRPQEIAMSAHNPNKPSTFAEMGIATTRAKKDECLVRLLFFSIAKVVETDGTL
ncbi:hypothetical protein RQP46_006968 [Phenoliferia psychrophenolica]